MNIKIIKLINNERIDQKIISAKACEYPYAASDYCVSNAYDYAHCTTYAQDLCGKDYAACYDGADDICSNIDTTVCNGPGVEDNTW